MPPSVGLFVSAANPRDGEDKCLLETKPEEETAILQRTADILAAHATTRIKQVPAAAAAAAVGAAAAAPGRSPCSAARLRSRLRYP